MVDGRVRSGKASAEKMTAEQRKERAMKGVEARKARADLPKAAYQGVLNIGDMSIPCAVLEDGRRVIFGNFTAQLLLICAGRGGDHLHRHAEFLCVFGGNLLVRLVLLGLEV